MHRASSVTTPRARRPSLASGRGALVLVGVVLVPFVALLVAVLAVHGDPLGVDTWWAAWSRGGTFPAWRRVHDS